MSKEWFKNPDVWAVIIAVLALGVSIVTQLDVRRQLRLAAGQIRSYVQISEAELLEPIDKSSFVKIQLKLKNYGQTAAVKVYGEMDYAVGIPDPKGEGNEATRRLFGSMGPGMERTVVLTSNRINRRDWPPPQPRYYPTIYFFGTIWATDDTTEEQRIEDWCYALNLKTESDLKKTELEACSILTYTSKFNK